MHAQFVEWGEKSQLRRFLDVEFQLVIKWKLQPYVYFSVRIRIVSVFGLEEYARIKAVESFNKPGARCWRPGIGVHWYGDFLVNHGGGFCCGFVILLLPVCILWLEFVSYYQDTMNFLFSIGKWLISPTGYSSRGGFIWCSIRFLSCEII